MPPSTPSVLYRKEDIVGARPPDCNAHTWYNPARIQVGTQTLPQGRAPSTRCHRPPRQVYNCPRISAKTYYRKSSGKPRWPKSSALRPLYALPSALLVFCERQSAAAEGRGNGRLRAPFRALGTALLSLEKPVLHPHCGDTGCHYRPEQLAAHILFIFKRPLT